MMETGLHTPEWEAWLGSLEDKYAGVWPRAVDQAHVLTPDEAHFLKTFTVAQLHRNPGRVLKYEAARDIAHADRKPIYTLGRLIQVDAMPSGKKDVMVSLLLPTIMEIARVVSGMSITRFFTDDPIGFITGDDPVIMSNVHAGGSILSPEEFRKIPLERSSFQSRQTAVSGCPG